MGETGGMAGEDSQGRRSRWPELIAVGRVVKPHGVRGEVALEAWGELGRHLRKQTEFMVGGTQRVLTSVRGAHDRLIGAFEGFVDRDVAETLRGDLIEIPSSLLPLPSRGDLYLFELESCEVLVGDGGDSESPRSLGQVVQVIEDGGGLLLEVRAPGIQGSSEEPAVYLIPFVKAYLQKMDMDTGTLWFSLPQGLLETCVSTS